MSKGILFTEGFDWRPNGGGSLSDWSGTWADVNAAYAYGTGKGARDYSTNRPWCSIPTTDHVVAHFFMRTSAHATEQGLCAFLANNDPNEWQLKVNIDSSVGAIVVYRGSTEIGRTANNLIARNSPWYGIELRVKFDNTVGEVNLRLDGVEVLALTNQDTQNTAYNDCTGFMFRVDIGNYLYYDHIVIRDYSVTSAILGNLSVIALAPSGNGNSTQLTGSDGDSVDNYLLVDESPSDSDTTYVQSSTVGHKDTYALADTNITTGYVYAVKVNLIARSTDGVTRQIQPVIRHSTNETTGSTQTLTGSYVARSSLFNDVPGGTDWTIAQVDALEAGQVVVS